MTLLVEDSALREAFRRGDKEALTRVYREYARDILAFLKRGFVFDSGGKRLCFAGLKEPWRLESVAQEVFIRAFSEPARVGYDGLRPFKNYLYTIARNLMIDQLRKSNREFVGLEEVGDQAEEDIFSGRKDSPEEEAGAQQLQKHVTKYLAALDPAMRAIFAARFENGQSIEEVARTLEMTEYRVKRDEKKIKKQFFYYMQQHGYFAGYEFDELGIDGLIMLVLVFAGHWSG